MVNKKKWLAVALMLSLTAQPLTYANAASDTAQPKEPETAIVQTVSEAEPSMEKAAEELSRQRVLSEAGLLADFLTANNLTVENLLDDPTGETTGFTLQQDGEALNAFHVTAVDLTGKDYTGTLNLKGAGFLKTVKAGSAVSLVLGDTPSLESIDLSAMNEGTAVIQNVYATLYENHSIVFPKGTSEATTELSLEGFLGEYDEESDSYRVFGALDLEELGVKDKNPVVYAGTNELKPDASGVIALKEHIGKEIQVVFKPESNVTISSNWATVIETEVQEGWAEQDGRWTYTNEDGKLCKNGIVPIGEHEYWFDENGYLMVGLFSDEDGNTYYANDTDGSEPGAGSYGVLTVNAWKKLNNSWYFFDKDGVMQKNKLLELSDGTYLMNKDGVMLTGKQSWNGKNYFFNGSGRMVKNGWGYAGGLYYWLDKNGEMLLNDWLYINGTYYWLDKDGVMAANEWLVINGHYYHFNKWGDMSVGWYKEKDTYYYLNKWGDMQTGWKTIDGKRYYFKSWGGMAVGWVRDNGNYYYMNKWGAMVTGWAKAGKYWYFMDENGVMTTGWQQSKGKWYYMNGSGAMVTGWLNVGQDRFYLKSDGTRVANQWYTIDGKKYFFDDRGRVVRNGWTYINGYKFYLDGNGNIKQDVTSLIGKQSSYYLTVNRSTCVVTAYAWDSQTKGWKIPVKAMTCSVGMPDTPTPVGTFTTPNKYRWHTLMGPSYGQWCTRIVGGVLFHSVAGNNMTSHNLWYGDFNRLGSPASHGCVRLCVRDAKWIYDNCPLGTTVTIGDGLYQPFAKPYVPKMTPDMDYDPTDPNA